MTCACYTLHEIAARGRRAADAAWIVRDYLQKTAAQRYPPAAVRRRRACSSSSTPPSFPTCATPRASASSGTRAQPFVATAGQTGVRRPRPAGQRGARARSRAENVTPWLLELKLPLMEEELFRTFDHQFEVIKYLEPLFAENIAHRIRARRLPRGRAGRVRRRRTCPSPTPPSSAREDGPVVLEEDVEVADFAYFVGPVHVGARTRIIERASLKEHVCIGETCKIGGEVEASIIESFTNKQHHGFLGHSWVGSWVNLGAGTSNSDLKNTYGEVRLEYPHRRVDTGMQFLGCIIGDYAKSAINTSIFTGKIIGVSSMLYGFVGSNVPSFCNYARSFGQITECPVDQAILIQKRMFARRGIARPPRTRRSCGTSSSSPAASGSSPTSRRRCSRVPAPGDLPRRI